MKTVEVENHESLAALMLPHDPASEMLHQYALEAFRHLNGHELERIVETAAAMHRRYLIDLERVGEEGFRSFVGTREVARMSALVEKVLPRITHLRDEAYKLARARVQRETGVLVDLPRYAEPQSSTTGSTAAQPAPAPAQAEGQSSTAPAPQARPELATRRDIKSALQMLSNLGVTGAELRALQERCKVGYVTLEQLDRWATELAPQPATA